MNNSYTPERCPECKNEREANSASCAVCGADAPDVWPAPLPSYQFSGKCPPLGALLLISVALLSGVVVGVGYHAIAPTADYPVISPMIGGMIAGTAVLFAMKMAHCRNRKLIVALAFLAGLTMYTTRIVADSQALRPEMVHFFTDYLVDRGASPMVARTKVEHALTPWTTLRFFLKAQSKEGVTITDSNSSSYTVDTGHGTKTVGGTQINGVLYWLLLFAELIAAGFGGTCLTLLFVRVLDPYCERDNRWMKGKRLLRLAPQQASSVVDLIRSRNWDQLARTSLKGAIDDKNKVDVMRYECPICHSGSIAVQVITANNPKIPLHVVLERDTLAQISTPNGNRR